MNSRERVEMALNFEAPDRTPIFASFVPEIEERLRTAFNISDADVGVALGNDMVKCCAGMEMSFYGHPEPRCMGHPLALCKKRFRGIYRDRRTSACR